MHNLAPADASEFPGVARRWTGLQMSSNVHYFPNVQIEGQTRRNSGVPANAVARPCLTVRATLQRRDSVSLSRKLQGFRLRVMSTQGDGSIGNS